MKNYNDLLNATNADGERFLKTWVKEQQPKAIDFLSSPNWFYVTFSDTLVVSLPTINSGCKASFFGDLKYYLSIKTKL